MNTTNSRDWCRFDEDGPYALLPDTTPSLLPGSRLCCAGWRGLTLAGFDRRDRRMLGRPPYPPVGIKRYHPFRRTSI